MMASFEPGRVVHCSSRKQTISSIARCSSFRTRFSAYAVCRRSPASRSRMCCPNWSAASASASRAACSTPTPMKTAAPIPPGWASATGIRSTRSCASWDVPAHIHATGSRSDREPYSLHFINEEDDRGLQPRHVRRADRLSRPQDRRQPRWRGDSLSAGPVRGEFDPSRLDPALLRRDAQALL